MGYGSSNGGHGANKPLPIMPKGTYGNPYTKYYGPGLHHLKHILQKGQYETRVNGKTGKTGIVLGKYRKTKRDKKTITQHDAVEMSGPNSEIYKDAHDLAKNSGYGYSVLDEGFFDDANFADMQKHYIKEDTPVVEPSPLLKQPVPEAKQVDYMGDLKEMFPTDFSTQSEITPEQAELKKAPKP